jgi:hypothetical protein
MLDEILLRKLAEWRPDTANPTLSLTDPAGAWSVTLDAEAVETIGSQLRRVSVRPVTATVAAPLREQADRLAREVTGLLEPLRVVEVDDGAAVAQLRSHAPAQRDGATRYYEVTRHADGTTHLGRYQTRPAEGKRQAIPFSLTHEALAKIVRDFTA